MADHCLARIRRPSDRTLPVVAHPDAAATVMLAVAAICAVIIVLLVLGGGITNGGQPVSSAAAVGAAWLSPRLSLLEAGTGTVVDSHCNSPHKSRGRRRTPRNRGNIGALPRRESSTAATDITSTVTTQTSSWLVV